MPVFMFNRVWHYIRPHRVIMTFCLSGALVAGEIGTAGDHCQLRGRQAAYRDIRQGRYKALGYGLPTPWRSEYAQCLQERYNISFRPVAGCVVSESLVSYVNAYHSVVD